MIVLFMVFKYQLCFPENSFNLSGKYKGYNVILIISECLRPDYLSCYGYPKRSSPSIDLLAQQGVLFNNAFSQASLTLPSVVSIFTSLYPFSHGVRYIFKDKVPEKVYTLAQILKIYGYSTVWFGAINDPHTGKGNGVLKGFNEKYDLWEQNSPKENYSVILNWLKKHRRENFFIMVHSYLTHESIFPYMKFNNEFTYNISNKCRAFFNTIIPEKFWKNLQDMLQNNQSYIYKTLGEEWIKKHKEYCMQPYSPERAKAIFNMVETPEQRITLQTIYCVTFFPYFKSFDEVFLSDFYSLLDGAIFELDKNLIGELISELKCFKIYDKTIIIITTAHGTEYNEHGHMSHGQFLYDESIHIPLVMYLPGLNNPLKNDELVQSIDILPTLLDLLAIPIPYQAQGISLAGLMEGKNNALINKYVFSWAVIGDPLSSIRSKYWKFIQKLNIQKPNKDLIDSIPWLKSWLQNIRSKGEAGNNMMGGELFNLQEDKYEKNNLITINPEVAKDLKRCLDLKLNSLLKYQNGDSEFMPGLSEETKERIKKTGYW